MKVYAVTSGDYSDYHIVAITDDKEKAEALAELINKQDEYYDGSACVEEYDTKAVDIAVAHPNRKYFKVVSSAIDKWIIRCFELSLDDYLQYKDHSCYFTQKSDHFYDYWNFYCFARSQDQAIKKATDWLAKKKAEEAGL